MYVACQRSVGGKIDGANVKPNVIDELLRELWMGSVYFKARTGRCFESFRDSWEGTTADARATAMEKKGDGERF